MASTGSAKSSIKTIAKTKVVRTSSSKLKPRPATISRRISSAEIPVNIYDLGLIYTIEITEDNDVSVIMSKI